MSGADMPICDFPGCGKRFAKSHRLKKHRFVHFPTAQKPFKCDVAECSAAYARNAHLRRHKALTHSKPEGPIKCKTQGCVATFQSELEHKQHANRAHFQKFRTEKENFTCPICQRAFTKLYNLQEHEASHTGVNPFKCDYCQDEFDTHSKFKSHISAHRKELEETKHVPCPQCAQTFDTFKGYSIHKKLKHPTVHMCDKCGLAFSNGVQLRSHITTHSGIRTVFKCPAENCKKFYYYEKGLACHYASRHEGKSYVCQYCDKKLCTLQKLKHHLTLHDWIPKAPRLPPPVRRDTVTDYVRKRLKNPVSTLEMFNYRKPGPKRKQASKMEPVSLTRSPESTSCLEKPLFIEDDSSEVRLYDDSPCSVVRTNHNLES